MADGAKGQWAFYRYHLDDPLYFHDTCRVAIQTIGGAARERVIELLGKGAALIPVSIDPGDKPPGFVRLLDRKQPVDLQDPQIPAGWCNFWRQDDWSSTAYFYLDSPRSALPELEAVGARVRDLTQPEGSAEG